MSTVTIHLQDCLVGMQQLPENSVDAVITDPPYFLDKLKTDWNDDMLETGVTKSSQVKSLPAGMKFDPQQGIEFQAFMAQVGQEAYRVLKPGGFMLSFSAPRLVHRLGVGLEDAGFYIKDLWSWLYTQNQAKAMSLHHFLEKREDISDSDRQQLQTDFLVWKTPQIKSCLEPIICAQKPPQGTFLDNWLQYRVGLINTNAKIGEAANMFPANVMSAEPITGPLDTVFLVPKPTKAEKGAANKHVSVKPLALMEQLIRLVTLEGATVLDPFNGSGSTGVAAAAIDRNYIGFEVNPQYLQIATNRFAETLGIELVSQDQQQWTATSG